MPNPTLSSRGADARPIRFASHDIPPVPDDEAPTEDMPIDENDPEAIARSLNAPTLLPAMTPTDDVLPYAETLLRIRVPPIAAERTPASFDELFAEEREQPPAPIPLVVDVQTGQIHARQQAAPAPPPALSAPRRWILGGLLLTAAALSSSIVVLLING